jgi:hypothetical protein
MTEFPDRLRAICVQSSVLIESEYCIRILEQGVQTTHARRDRSFGNGIGAERRIGYLDESTKTGRESRHCVSDWRSPIMIEMESTSALKPSWDFLNQDFSTALGVEGP